MSKELRPRKSENLECHCNVEGINAEFKSLRLRIKRLEELLLNQITDSGLVSEDVNKLKKG